MPHHEDTIDILDFSMSSGQPFFGSGIRSYGTTTILGKPQASQCTTDEAEYLDDNVVIIGGLMDGTLLAIQKDQVLYINQQEPEYEHDWRSCAIRTNWSLAEFSALLETAAEGLPSDFEEARHRFAT
jgi:hypothetical protein